MKNLSKFGLLLIIIGLLGCGNKDNNINLSNTEVQEIQNEVKSHPVQEQKVDRQALLDEYFNQLKDINRNWKSIGFILEELVKIKLRDEYPPDEYEIIGGIEYEGYDNNPKITRTIGELDIVIINNDSNKVELVSEVKLSGNLDRAGKKASSQIARFQNWLRNSKIIRFIYLDNPSRKFTVSQFRDVREYWRIGNTGALEAGFDYEIDLHRDEADILQRRLLDYRSDHPISAASSSSNAEIRFIANKNSKVLHYYTAKHLPAPANRVNFRSYDKAIKAGYKPHDCIPDDERK